jgi:succinyl-diaminopimelate desuccinylase
MDIKKIILQKATELRQEIIDFERELVRTPSPNPPGEYEKISKCVAGKLQEIGYDVEMVKSRPEKPNVIGRLKGTTGTPSLITCAHLDAVPEGSGWTVDPYEAVMKDGKIFGRGAYDAKARITVYVMAAKLIREAGFRLKGDLIGCFTVDEETGGYDGARYCGQQGYLKADMAILEGRQDEIWYAESGHATIRIGVKGQSAHAMYPWLGISAIDKMTDVLIVLRKLQKKLKRKTSDIPGLSYSTINVGTINGGDKSNMLADRCSIDVDIRVIPEVDIDEVIGTITEMLEMQKKEDPNFIAEMEILMKAEPTATQPDTPIIDTIKRVSGKVLGFEPKAVGLHATSDGKYFRKEGIPTIHWGVGTSANLAHGADEHINIEDLINLAAAHALVYMDFLGYE